MKTCAKREADRKTFMEQVRESKESGYLLSSRKIGSGAFSKVFLGYATQENLRQNYKLASDLRSKRHTMVAIQIIPTFLPREIYSLNATSRHINVLSPSCSPLPHPAASARVVSIGHPNCTGRRPHISQGC
uniref:Protein kinase domain-containing protein n=1 Tax=Chrysemys picta bellii TaxID=8478 RepID=A0A8C3IBL3_CHRPI